MLNVTIDTNPVVVAPGVTIVGPSNALFGNHGASGYFVVENYGTIAGSKISGKGVYLSPGGSVTNAASASITGNRGVGIYAAAGTVVNDGSIAGTGNKGIGVNLNSGGSVSNGTAGSITGFEGVKVLDGLGTVVNYGDIAGSDHGVYLFSGGSATNAASGTIAGDFDGVLIAVAAGTVINQGSIVGTGANGIGVQLNSGGLVSNAASASLTGVYEGVKLETGGAVMNYAAIAATGTSGSGAFLADGGAVSNAAAGTIGGAFGVAVFGATGTVANDGSIVSTGTYARGGGFAGGVGVYFRYGGAVTNTASGTIAGYVAGVNISGGSTGVVVNDGSIASPGGSGVALYSGGSVTNTAGASISAGNIGVDLAGGGSLTDAGAIIAANAVLFGGTGNNLLALAPGYRISGTVTGSTSAANTLELASAASIGTLVGLGAKFTNFGAIDFVAGADWSITGNASGLAGAISGFTVGDTIELTAVVATGSSFSSGVLTLDVTGGFVTLDLPGSFGLEEFNVTPGSGDTVVTVLPCFAAGTRIACRDGERTVEDLAPGDTVWVVGAGFAEITWIGHREVNCARHPRPADVWPVRVRAGAFGAGMPHRDLLLSPDHAVFLDGALIPIRYLVNGRTIVQEPVASVTYYHVELAAHALILAEGLPCESYLDTGNRAVMAA